MMIDELVAEHVMGWSYQTFPNGITPDIKHWYSCTPCPNDALHESFEGRCPSFVSDVGYDYEVLDKVRNEWRRREQYSFYSQLHETWIKRGYDEWPFGGYGPGDYSLAALAVRDVWPIKTKK